MKRFFAAALVACIAPCAWSQDDAAERSRIASERAAVDARFAARQRECNALFAVNDCLRKAT
ncbi:MAG TPA: hypothetical protein VEB23_03995, partial [Ramlibacter sp.]|nr:hypothetical protein [Ramlibacter sp.]